MIFKHIVIGADSAGYHLKEQIKEKLIADGYDVTDCGTRMPPATIPSTARQSPKRCAPPAPTPAASSSAVRAWA